MPKTILITGSTDGIGLETARTLGSLGHHVLLHGRNRTKLQEVARSLSATAGGNISSYVADLSVMTDVWALTKAVTDEHSKLDVLINNAGVYSTSTATTPDGLDVRFAVNTIAPYLITQRLLPLLGRSGRVINLSSAAQSSVDYEGLIRQTGLSDGVAYAQSKLALTMWSRALATTRGGRGPAIVAVNPGSMLGTKMVKDAFGVAGGDVRIGADVLVRAALAEEFAAASGQYFDNDSGRFTAPHDDALDPQKCQELVDILDNFIGNSELNVQGESVPT